VDRSATPKPCPGEAQRVTVPESRYPTQIAPALSAAIETSNLLRSPSAVVKCRHNHSNVARDRPMSPPRYRPRRFHQREATQRSHFRNSLELPSPGSAMNRPSPSPPRSPVAVDQNRVGGIAANPSAAPNHFTDRASDRSGRAAHVRPQPNWPSAPPAPRESECAQRFSILHTHTPSCWSPRKSPASVPTHTGLGYRQYFVNRLSVNRSAP